MKGDRQGEIVFKAIEMLTKAFFGLLVEGVRNRPKNFWDFWGTLATAGGVVFVIWDLFFLWIPREILFLFAVLGVLTCWGFVPWRDKRSYQKKLAATGLKSFEGQTPRILDLRDLGGGRKTILVDTYGVGITRYKAKKSDLESTFGGIVESFKTEKNPRFVKISLATMPLPTTVGFFEIEERLKGRTNFFVAGKSYAGTVAVDLSTLPHLLIAGTTGGGKSVFFKQVLFSLLKTTPGLQMYLLDLKKGVEMRAFENLPNVEVAKNETEAFNLLRRLKAEMDRRFSYLEKNKRKEIVPEKDKMDRIVIGVDEASVIFTKTKFKGENKELIERARELMDELAKLSRAAGMNLILATQKVSKETIDTRVQENIGGKMCFRMNTLAGSMNVLGKKTAHDLPDIKGRGIWSRGSDFLEVQTPFLKEEDLEKELEKLAEEIKDGGKSFVGPMLSEMSEKKKKENKKPTGDANNERQKKTPCGNNRTGPGAFRTTF